MDQRIWRALGDPTRRQILDLLRDGPCTTGDLARHFEQSRYGVMKHLTVLESAGLVLVRRQGRQRWNHLNAVPLRRIYERWLGPYQEFWSSSLLRLDRVVEARQRDQAAQEGAMSEFNKFEINQEIKLDAPPQRVWAALTAEIGSWWAYRVGEEGSTVQLDARLGGTFEERWGDGEGAIWGEVVDIRKGKRLRLRGCLGMTGAGVNDYTYELEPSGDGTLLKLTHHALGFDDKETESGYKEGWDGLFNKFLPAWLHEGKTADQVKAAEA
jgi:DNA-binding transcriptional ArsR family regulator/uncharacterized protein YndB with AHSA1/START domain